MYEHRTAYLVNGEAEGFLGRGATKARAKADAVDQIRKKIDIVNADREPEDAIVFVKANHVDSPSRLTPKQLEAVQADWRSGVRY